MYFPLVEEVEKGEKSIKWTIKRSKIKRKLDRIMLQENHMLFWLPVILTKALQTFAR